MFNMQISLPFCEKNVLAIIVHSVHNALEHVMLLGRVQSVKEAFVEAAAY